MALSTVLSRATCGIDAPLVRVETHLSNGLPCFTLVGLPETAVRESRERVRSAIINSHLSFPDQRITINLSPADLPKEGGRFDLPIALGILAASEQLPMEALLGGEFLGELGLDGELRPVSGVITAAQAVADTGRTLHLPNGNAPLAALIPEVAIIGAGNLLQLCAHLNGREPLSTAHALPLHADDNYPDLRHIVGQSAPRRALEIAAAGGHNLLMSGAPGSGKTLLARCLAGLLPPPSLPELLPTLAMQNLSSSTVQPQLKRPFRSPHHSASGPALVGGGSHPRPGEISLAHGGVLFLDELPEFPRQVLDMLRQPLEEGHVTLVRAKHRTTYPARFQLVAAMNPCLCGYYGDPDRDCRCSPEQIQRYLSRVSGPLLDRFDLYVHVQRIAFTELSIATPEVEPSSTVRVRVTASQTTQQQRQGCLNTQLPHQQLTNICQLSRADTNYLETSAEKLKLSLRGFHRTLRVARTIADLESSEVVEREHVAQALAFREQH